MYKSRTRNVLLGTSESDGEDDVWVERAERKLQEHGPEAVRTAVVIETVADPLGIYKEYAVARFGAMSWDIVSSCCF